jgi:hypothetical protein
MSRDVLNYAPAQEFDTGLFVARYLQALAVLRVAWMIAGPIFFDRFNLDLSPIILLWLASALKRHSSAARKWLLICSTFGLLLCAYLVAHALIFGTNHLTVHLGRPIHNPALWQVSLVSLSMATIVGVPFVVLLSARARRQFGLTSAQSSPQTPSPI